MSLVSVTLVFLGMTCLCLGVSVWCLSAVVRRLEAQGQALTAQVATLEHDMALFNFARTHLGTLRPGEMVQVELPVRPPTSDH